MKKNTFTKIYKSDNFKLSIDSTHFLKKDDLKLFTDSLIAIFIDNKIDYRATKKLIINNKRHITEKKYEELYVCFPCKFIFYNKHNISDFSIKQQVLKIIQISNHLYDIQQLNRK